MKLRIGKDLEKLMQAYAGYVHFMVNVEMSLAMVAEKAVAEWESNEGRQLPECSAAEPARFATSGGTVLTVKCERPAAEVQRIIKWFLDRHPLPEMDESTLARLAAMEKRLRAESFSMHMKQRRRLDALKLLQESDYIGSAGAVIEA